MAAKRIVVAREAFACQHDGREVLVPQGTRLAASHPIVKGHGHYFEPAERVDEP